MICICTNLPIYHPIVGMPLEVAAVNCPPAMQPCSDGEGQSPEWKWNSVPYEDRNGLMLPGVTHPAAAGGSCHSQKQKNKWASGGHREGNFPFSKGSIHTMCFLMNEKTISTDGSTIYSTQLLLEGSKILISLSLSLCITQKL